MRIADGDEVVVGRGDKALHGIRIVRLLLDGEKTGPLVAAIAGHRDESAEVLADGGNADRLPADVTVHIGPDHVLARDVAEGGRVAELLPRRGLIHAQGRHVRRTAGLEPRCAHGIGHVVRRVLVDDGTVPRVLERDLLRGLALHRNGLAHGGHREPLSVEAVLRGVGGIGLVDVEVLAVGAENGETPGADFVVADGDAGHGGLAATDHVPAGRHEMDEAPERRCGLCAMRIVGHQGQAREGESRAHHPIITADVATGLFSQRLVERVVARGKCAGASGIVPHGELEIGWLEPHRCAKRVVQLENRRR